MNSRGWPSYAIWVVGLGTAAFVGMVILYGLSAASSLPGLNGDSGIVQSVSNSVEGAVLLIAVAIIGVIVAWYLASKNSW